MHHRAYLRVRVPQHKLTSNSIHHIQNFSATSQGLIHQILNYESKSTAEHYTYTNLLSSCLQHCKKVQSRRLFDEMPQRLQLASRASKLIHAQSLKLGVGSIGQLGNAIVDLYAKCGNVDFAEKAFARLEKRDTLAWNSVLSMYSKQGMLEHVLQSFVSMRNFGVLPNQFTYAIGLSASARLIDVEFGKQVHCEVIKVGFELNSFCEGSLIDMYAKCSRLFDARQIFDEADDPDTISWTAMIAGYIQIGLPHEALRLFDEMQQLGRIPDQVAFVTIINAFIGLRRLDEACRLFYLMPCPNAVAWNMMISGHTKKGFDVQAIMFFKNMMKAGIKSTRSTLGSALSAIASLANLGYGLQVHAQATKQGLDSNVYVGSSLINMYAKCQKMEPAMKVFDALEDKNIVLWNAMLGGYAQNGYANEVVSLFMNMMDSGLQPDEFTYTSILSACACLKNVEMGSQLHSFIIKHKFESNLFAGNALVDMYAKSNSLNDARQQFERMKNRDNVSWNAIIVGYVQEEEEDEAFILFKRMRSCGIEPDEVSLASILSACANIQCLDKGKQLHSFLVKYGLETSLYAVSSLIDMYVKCKATNVAHEVFYCMTKPSVVSINALIAGYAQENIEEAVNLFRYMMGEGLNPSEVTFASLLDGCSVRSGLNLGKQIHGSILKMGLQFDDEFLAVSLLGMYINGHENIDASTLFDEFPYPKSRVLWTAMISGLTQNDCSEEALLLYHEMRIHNVMPDQAAFVSVLRACSVSTSLWDGKKIHSLIFHTGFDLDESTCSTLVDMYAKCGEVQCSVQVFDEMIIKNEVISWNSMIVGFAKNGHAENALRIFHKMTKTHARPDDVTFLGVLTACSHAGWVNEGRRIFDIMISEYGIQPRSDHCACMIDLLGRWGFLKEADEFIEKLGFEPDAMIWATYLGACKIHGDEVRGQYAAKKLIKLEPKSSSPYVLLSNIYASLGNWDGVNSMRRVMRERGVRKYPGCSWIVVQQKTHLFIAGDKFHPCSGEIVGVLKDLTVSMKDEGCAFECEVRIYDER